jgi:fructose/tagatose bisphosphate aldolase
VSISSSSFWQVYKALSAIPNSMFTIAAAFGNVHGVYKAGNVQLRPEILGNAQAYAKEQLKVIDLFLSGCYLGKKARHVSTMGVILYCISRRSNTYLVL